MVERFKSFLKRSMEDMTNVFENIRGFAVQKFDDFSNYTRNQIAESKYFFQHAKKNLPSDLKGIKNDIIEKISFNNPLDRIKVPSFETQLNRIKAPLFKRAKKVTPFAIPQESYAPPTRFQAITNYLKVVVPISISMAAFHAGFVRNNKIDYKADAKEVIHNEVLMPDPYRTDKEKLVSLFKVAAHSKTKADSLRETGQLSTRQKDSLNAQEYLYQAMLYAGRYNKKDNIIKLRINDIKNNPLNLESTRVAENIKETLIIQKNQKLDELQADLALENFGNTLKFYPNATINVDNDTVKISLNSKRHPLLVPFIQLHEDITTKRNDKPVYEHEKTLHNFIEASNMLPLGKKLPYAMRKNTGIPKGYTFREFLLMSTISSCRDDLEQIKDTLLIEQEDVLFEQIVDSLRLSKRKNKELLMDIDSIKMTKALNEALFLSIAMNKAIEDQRKSRPYKQLKKLEKDTDKNFVKENLSSADYYELRFAFAETQRMMTSSHHDKINNCIHEAAKIAAQYRKITVGMGNTYIGKTVEDQKKNDRHRVLVNLGKPKY